MSMNASFHSDRYLAKGRIVTPSKDSSDHRHYAEITIQSGETFDAITLYVHDVEDLRQIARHFKAMAELLILK